MHMTCLPIPFCIFSLPFAVKLRCMAHTKVSRVLQYAECRCYTASIFQWSIGQFNACGMCRVSATLMDIPGGSVLKQESCAIAKTTA